MKKKRTFDVGDLVQFRDSDWVTGQYRMVKTVILAVPSKNNHVINHCVDAGSRIVHTSSLKMVKKRFISKNKMKYIKA